MSSDRVQQAYALAKERYAEIGVDAEQALQVLEGIALSMHCWQGDDVTGFESAGDLSDGGIMATGNYPGRARNADELRADMEAALRLIPGRHRVNLHAIYAETGSRPVPRNELAFEHFRRWTDWAAERELGIDFNPTFFAHPQAASGFTLASANDEVRGFWIEHGIVCRRIGAEIGRRLGKPCVTNVWIPDGYKDLPADRKAPRERLRESLDAMFAEKLDPACHRDSVESKLFGIGSESYVAGSHEFYLAYAVRNGALLCLDSGHFHPTEGIADKISGLLVFLDELLLHLSRGVRWDSDHVVLLTDDVQDVANEVVRGGCLDRVHLALDFFDASINRIAAWVIGMRAAQKALLRALLEPAPALREHELNGDYTARLALLETVKTLPFAAVWDRFCAVREVPCDGAWMQEVKAYEKDVLSGRG